MGKFYLSSFIFIPVSILALSGSDYITHKAAFHAIKALHAMLNNSAVISANVKRKPSKNNLTSVFRQLCPYSFFIATGK
jgi:hypothetical protein